LEAKRLERLTTDFLTYARPGSGSFRQVDVSVLIGYIVSIVQPHALQKHLQIDATGWERCQLFGDEGQIQQALLNLMRNAIEASPQNARISITVESVTEGYFHIRIENAGSAIPSHIVQHIFEPFFTSKEGGTGLGLAIVRSIVDRHRGELMLERNDPDHIVFTMALPILEPNKDAQLHLDTEF
ncbi:MAG: HAMP domain-containing sensor histidine kinase, partial [Acidobacteriaceae bacterium]|nr:HAMP domain-containing sensor histidine kinase [Acidobacteriaceae bacterium]